MSTAPAVTPEVVQVLKLNMLQDNPGAVKKVRAYENVFNLLGPNVDAHRFPFPVWTTGWWKQKRRIGRGIGSSKGKTAGRGHKGQKARSGGSVAIGFEGGQTKFYKLVPKRGFTNKPHKTNMLGVNVGTLQDFIDMGRLPQVQNGKVLTLRDLVAAGVATSSSIKHGIKLLAKGKERLTSPIQIETSRASKEAIRAVEEAGGEVTTVHYNRLALRALLKPEKFERLPKFARPPPKWQTYYTNWERNRGYLSVQAQMRELLKKRPELENAFADALEGSRRKVGENEDETTEK